MTERIDSVIKVNIDEKELQDGSHIEIRKRKEGIVVVKIPKGTMLKDVLIQTDSIHTNN